jgi:[ribosomal protein S5]-alanine N-acetyltransferase
MPNTSVTERIFTAGHWVTIRPIARADVGPEYVGWLQDPEVNRYLETRFTEQNQATVAAFVERILASEDEHLFAICLDGKHVGNIKIGPVKHRHQVADVSLFIGNRAAWGKGVATAAISLVSHYGVRMLGLRKLSAGVYASNRGSTGAFLRAGYVQEGHRRDHYLMDGTPVDLLEFGLRAQDLPALPPTPPESRSP